MISTSTANRLVGTVLTCMDRQTHRHDESKGHFLLIMLMCLKGKIFTDGTKNLFSVTIHNLQMQATPHRFPLLLKINLILYCQTCSQPPSLTAHLTLAVLSLYGSESN